MAVSETPQPAPTLREARDALGLRQRDVAEQAGCSISAVSMAEHGYVPPKLREPLAVAVGASSGSFWQ